MATPQLLYSIQTLIRKAKCMFRIQGAQMRFLRAARGCTMSDLTGHNHIRMELGTTESLYDKISQYKTEWQLHVEVMNSTRFPRKAFDYRPRRERSVGNPINNGWINSIETGTGF